MAENGELYQGYKIKGLGTFPMYEIKAQGQGQIPEDLKGTYTSKPMAQRAIDFYLGSLLKRGRKQHGEKESVA